MTKMSIPIIVIRQKSNKNISGIHMLEHTLLEKTWKDVASIINKNNVIYV